MKKRLLAWLLVFCMTVSLVPGTAFAADGDSGGSGSTTTTPDDTSGTGGGTATNKKKVIFDLNDLDDHNDRLSTYRLMLELEDGQKPEDFLAASWPGHEFNGWTGIPKDYKYTDGTVITATWRSGYDVCFDQNYPAGSGTGQTIKIHVDTTGMLSAQDREAVMKYKLDGYILLGWFVKDDKDETLVDLATYKFSRDNETLCAKWLKSHEITFDYNGGTGATTSTAKLHTGEGGKLTELPETVTRKDFSFKGWLIKNSDPAVTLSEAELGNYSFTAATTLTAQWGAPYTITYNAGKGYFGDPSVKTTTKNTNEDGLFLFPDDPVWPGHTFLGWVKEKPDTDSLEDSTTTIPPVLGPSDTSGADATANPVKTPETLYALWHEGYKITFKYVNGTEKVLWTKVDGSLNKTIEDLTPIMEEDAKKIQFYVFDKWTWDVDNKEEVHPSDVLAQTYTRPVTITGHWLGGYRIAFIDRGKVTEIRTDTKGYIWSNDSTSASSSHKAPANPTMNGGEFQGWYSNDNSEIKLFEWSINGKNPEKDNDKGGTKQQFTASAEFNAKWKYTITYSLEQGVATSTGAPTETKMSDVEGKASFNTPSTNPSRTGYSFNGWVVKQGNTIIPVDSNTNGKYTVTGPVTVTVEWGPPYGITYQTAKDETTPNDMPTKTGQDGRIDLSKISPSLSDHTHNGWKVIGVDGKETDWTSSYTATGPVTIRSIWEKNTTTKSTPGVQSAAPLRVPVSTFSLTSVPTPHDGTADDSSTDTPSSSGGDNTGGSQEGASGTNPGTTTPTTPATPTGSKVTFFINNIDLGSENPPSAHFVMYADTTNRLSALPDVIKLNSTETYQGFGGWSMQRSNGGKVSTSQTYISDSTLYGIWTQSVTVTFDWNCDDGSLGTYTAPTGLDGKVAEKDQPKTENVRPGYYFDKWCDKDGKQIDLSTKVFSESTTIYAHWKGPYTITFDPNGGAFGTDKTPTKVETNDTGSLDSTKIPADPVMDGATFGGWSATKENPTKVDNPAKDPFTGPATFYAIWQAPFKITLDVNGGDKLEQDTVMTDDKGVVPKIADPTHTKDGFAGWFTSKDEDGQQVKPGDTLTAPVTLYAKWQRQPPYTVTFHANGTGAVMDEDSSEPDVTFTTDDKGKLIDTIPTPIWKGHTFSGWFERKEANYGEAITGLQDRTYEDDCEFYAHWSTFDFKLTFDYNFDSIPVTPTISPNVTQTVTTKGGAIPKLPVAASNGYRIKGWYKVKEPTDKDKPVAKDDLITKDTTLYAIWEKGTETFTGPTVEFFADEEGKVSLVTLEVGTDSTIKPFPAPPYKQGYVFESWYTRAVDGTETDINEDTLVTGDWKAYPRYSQVYTITFDPNYEDGDTTTMKTEHNRLPSLPTPTRPDYTFNGWFTEKTGGEEVTTSTKFSADTTVYAHWTKNGENPPDNPDNPDTAPYTITFDANGGEVSPSTQKTDDKGQLSSLPTPTRAGYTFDGWFTAASGGSAVTTSYTFQSNTTVYAHWSGGGGGDNPSGPTSAPFTITFNANGGVVNVSTLLTDMNGRLTSLPTPQRTGYSFDGWYSGENKVTTATVFSSNTTVTAKWTTGSGSGNGSGSGSNGENDTFSITTQTNISGGRISASATYAREGDYITVTVRPYSGYQLDRIDAYNSRGRDISLRDQGGNRYTFYMPASRVTIEASFKELAPSADTNTGTSSGSGSTGGTGTLPGMTPGNNSPITSGMGVFSAPVLNTLPMPYTDVHPNDWFYSSADYLWKRSLMGGVNATQFGPRALTSNAMVWTLLARLGGVDVTSGSGIWYDNARTWAVSNKISDGVGPNSPVTREELATMLWRFKGSPSAGYDLGQFSDRGSISTYQAECALAWAAANNIVTGSNGRLNPRGSATRAEVAVMITRFCQNT